LIVLVNQLKKKLKKGKREKMAVIDLIIVTSLVITIIIAVKIYK
jgi:hypothetical protein